MASTFDRSNQVITFDTTGDSFSGPLSVEYMVLEGTAAASTISDGDGNVIAVLSVVGEPYPVKRRIVTGLVATTIGASAKVRVFMKKAVI